MIKIVLAAVSVGIAARIGWAIGNEIRRQFRMRWPRRSKSQKLTSPGPPFRVPDTRPISAVHHPRFQVRQYPHHPEE